MKPVIVDFSIYLISCKKEISLKLPQISDYRIDFYFQDTLLLYMTNQNGSIINYNTSVDLNKVVTSRKGFKAIVTGTSGENIIISLHQNNTNDTGLLIYYGFIPYGDGISINFDIPSHITSPIYFATDSYTLAEKPDQWSEIQLNKFRPSAAVTIPNNPQIQISCTTEGSSIYYTLDNSTPDSSKSLYSNQFEVESGTTIKAIAIKDGYIDSDIAEYVVN